MSSTEVKLTIEKLRGPDDWPQWKWQMNLILCAHGLETIVDGSRECPILAEDANEDQQKKVSLWKMDNAEAASFIASNLSRPLADLVLTSTSALGIWGKLCSRFERSSSQRLNMLIEEFFQSTRI